MAVVEQPGAWLFFSFLVGAICGAAATALGQRAECNERTAVQPRKNTKNTKNLKFKILDLSEKGRD